MALLSAIAIMFSVSSCAKSDDKKNDDARNDKEIISEDNNSSAEIEVTAPQSTEQILVDLPNPEQETIHVTTPDNVPVDYKQLYIDFINSNPTRYAENSGTKSEVDPLYTYLDIDNDGMEELIYFLKFLDLNMANLYEAQKGLENACEEIDILLYN